MLLLLGSCGEPVNLANGADKNRTPSMRWSWRRGRLRIGELGANFQACSAAGTTRNLRAGETLPVRSAPFDNAAGSGSVPTGARFFAAPAASTRNGSGSCSTKAAPFGALRRVGACDAPAGLCRPCRSGWVQSAFVKVVSESIRASLRIRPPPMVRRPQPLKKGFYTLPSNGLWYHATWCRRAGQSLSLQAQIGPPSATADPSAS